MKYDFLEIKSKLNQNYEEGIIKYTEGFGSLPSLPELLKIGYTKEQYDKLNKLYDIEHMKYILNEGIEEDELSKSEIKEIEDGINKAIEKYNNM